MVTQLKGWMRDHHISQHLHANLEDTDIRDYQLKEPQQETCSKEK